MSPSLQRLLCGVLSALLPVLAAAGDTAKVTQVYVDVRLQPASAAARPSSAGDLLPPGAALRTALKSRAELQFADGTLIRAGAVTSLQAGLGTRELVMSEGTAFMNVPFGLFSQGSRIRCGAVVAVGNGSAFLLEHTPSRVVKVNGQSKPVKGFVKAIALRGELRIALSNRIGESVLLEPGQMMILDPAAAFLPATVDIDITRLVATTLLLNPAKWNGGGTDMTESIKAQAALKKEGTLIETNLSIFGRGTDVMIKPPQTPMPPAAEVSRTKVQDPRKVQAAKVPEPPARRTPR